MNRNQTIIGIDGGATKISGAIIKQIDENTFSIFREICTTYHSENPLFDLQFQPVNLKIQNKEAIDPKLKISEEKQGLAILENFEKIITDIIGNLKGIKPLIGVGIPGIKSDDKRGINVVNNGPRIPRFLDVLEHRLTLNGLKFHPIEKLENDSNCCGLGELFGESGSFRDIKNGVFLGSGTGISDAILLNETLVSFDDIESWMPKTWQLKHAKGVPVESIISYKGLINQYSELIGIPFSKLVNDKIFPEQFLKSKIAQVIKSKFISTVAHLILQRIESLFSKFPNYHFDKIVLGLRFVPLFNEIPDLLDSIKNTVKKMIINSSILNQVSKIHYLENNTIVLSNLPDAPVIGAGVSAYFNDQ